MEKNYSFTDKQMAQINEAVAGKTKCGKAGRTVRDVLKRYGYYHLCYNDEEMTQEVFSRGPWIGVYLVVHYRKNGKARSVRQTGARYTGGI